MIHAPQRYGPQYAFDESELGTRAAYCLVIENTVDSDARCISITVRCEMAGAS